MLCNHGSDPLVAASPLRGLPLVYSAFCGNYTLCLVGKQQVNSQHLGAIFFYIFFALGKLQEPHLPFSGGPKGHISFTRPFLSCREKCARAKRKQKNEEPPGGWISFFFLREKRPGSRSQLGAKPVGPKTFEIFSGQRASDFSGLGILGGDLFFFFFTGCSRNPWPFCTVTGCIPIN